VEIRDENTHSSVSACLFQPNSRFEVVAKNNKIVFFTGTGIEKNKFDIYDISSNTWSIGELSQNIVGASLISVNNIIYVAGGYINGVLSNKVWKLEF
jgi:N-acetylneuraminic acid mutarotase